MKRVYATLLSAFAVLVSALPARALTAAPQTVERGNFRVPHQLIIGGNLNNTGFAGPNLILRPLSKISSSLDTTIQWTTPAAARTYTIPDAGANASFLMSAGAQTHAGVQTFTSIPIFPLGGITFTGTSFNTTLKALNAMGQATTITIPDPGASTANVVLDKSAQTIAGVKTFSSAPVITGGLPSSQIQTGSAKRQVVRVQLSPITAAAADSTVYAGTVAFGRAGTVTRITAHCTVAPTVGTDTIEVLKNNTTTMLSAATFDANSLTALVASNLTLTATGANLALTATDVVRCKYNAGAQTADAEDVTVELEYEPTDF